MPTRLMLLAILLAAPMVAAEPPRVVAHSLPDWWPASQFHYSGTRPPVAEDYDQATFSTGPKSEVTVRGRYWRAELVRSPEEEKLKQHPDGMAKWAALQSALESKGFKVVYEQQNHGVQATLQRGSGDSATWVKVQIDQPFNVGTLVAVAVASNPFSIELRPPSPQVETVGDKDNFPFAPPPPGSRLTGTEHFGQPMTFFTGEPGNASTPVGSGYASKDYVADPTISTIAFHDAYAAALARAGWTVTAGAHKADDVNAHYDKNGRDIYVHLVPGRFHVADVGRELAASLQKNCKAAVYGINFDFDKATLRPDSDPTLQQVLTVLKDQPSLAVEIGGHTDNVGKPDYNLSLSERRAAAVREWLVAHGVAASRLTSHGYGDTQPLLPNSSEENRAMNRRVELKKPNC